MLGLLYYYYPYYAGGSGFSGYYLYYFILVVPAIIVSMIAQSRVNSVYRRFSQVNNMRGLTGAMAAELVLKHYGINNVRIERIDGKLTDHYDPRTNVISLSNGVYGSCSIAAIGVACHEAGHAAQHAVDYTPIRVRNAVLVPAQIGSQAAMPLAILGLFMGWSPLIYFGIFLFIFVLLFQLVTLPVEFNASKRAIEVIEGTGMLADSETVGARKVLNAAAMTYVASFAVTAANLLRLLLLANNKRR